MNIWDPEHECISRDELEQLQLERLQAIINRVHKNVTCYRKKFNDLRYYSRKIFVPYPI